MIINKLKKYLVSVLLSSIPVIASEAEFKVRDLTELSGPHTSKDSRVEQARREMIDALDDFQAKEEDMLEFVKEAREGIAQGKKPIEINPFFKEMNTEKLTDWCGIAEQVISKNLETIKLNRKKAHEKLVSAAGITEFFEENFRFYLGFLQSREDNWKEDREQRSSGKSGDWCFISTLPTMEYSGFNKYVAQDTVDRFSFLTLMLKVLYTHVKVKDLSWRAKTFLNSVPSLKKFFDGEPAGDFDLDPDSLIKYFQRYKIEVEKKETKDRLASAGIYKMAVFAPLDPIVMVTEIPSPPLNKVRKRLQVMLQLKEKKPLKDKEEVLLERQISIEAEPVKNLKKKKKKKKKNKKRQNSVGVNSSILPSSAVVSATPLIDQLDSPEDDQDADSDSDMSSMSAAVAAVPMIPKPRHSKDEKVNEDEGKDEDTDTSLDISHSMSASAVHPAYGYDGNENDQDADLGTSHSLTILKGKVKDYFDSFWDSRSTGAGMDFDRQFVPLFEQLGGRIKFSGKGSSHCTLYYKGFKPEGTWRPHPKPELGHKTMLRLRGYFAKWGLTMKDLGVSS